MAIAFDAGTHKTAETGTTLTYSPTVGAGANRILVVGASDGDTSSDTITGITYGGVAMTRFPNGFVGSAVASSFLYFLVAPATGANNVVVTCSLSHSLRSACASYTGAAQTGQPDSGANEANTATPVELNGTTVADNSWAVGYCQAGDAITASAGTTLRGSGTGSAHQIMDKNAATTPAGAFTLNFTIGSTTESSSCFGSIAPVAATTTTSTSP